MAKAITADNDSKRQDGYQGGNSIAFWLVHVACALVLFTGVSWSAVAVGLATYWTRMFGITAGYHRYFSHRAFKTSRAFQFVLAVLGTTSVQKGVLWWAANHRNHHKYSDLPEDLHSPIQRGFWWSHVGWILSPDYDETLFERIPDMAKYPELRWLNQHYLVPPVTLAVALFMLGGMSWLVWGFFVSTVLLWHSTFLINSLAHVYGSRRYDTADTSRNNVWLALLTFGEGWHNNHHHFMNSVRQGFFWWEIDVSYYILKALSWVGITWDLIEPPARVRIPAAADARQLKAA
ncbi:MAG: acyl-CoA desaturase [Deltaproteobacteria bacterium]|nr:acyl-CoA desaturase [Deltaproteobacteria bacterium]MBI3389892.1 acyl-CoA desaturase [Deltaproteobacteria bacterium]